MMLNKNTQRVAIGVVVVTVLLVAIILGVRWLVPRDSMLRAGITPRTMMLGDSLYFIDSTDFATSYRWQFGDGQQSFAQKGYYRYKSPGNYTILLTVNNAVKDSFVVSVQGTGYVYDAHDSIFKIVAPAAALQGESVVFRIDGRGSDEFNWDFGDNSSPVRSTNNMVQHTFMVPGNYTVRLFSRNNHYPASHNIKINPGFQAFDPDNTPVAPGGQGGGAQQAMANDFKERLQKVANTVGDFNDHYYYLLKKYLCGREKTVVKVNGQKTNEYYSYLQNLPFKKTTIISVRLTLDEKMKCATLVEVDQQEE